MLTPALCRRTSVVCGRKAPTPPPKRLGRAIMPKLLSAGAVSTNALLAHISLQTPSVVNNTHYVYAYEFQKNQDLSALKIKI
jgi:hypothetical protein